MNPADHPPEADLEFALIVNRFVELSERWSAVPLTRPAAEANVISDEVWLLGEELRRTSKGREQLEMLATDHDSPAVRLKAAVTCLKWAPDQGVSALQEILDGRGEKYGMLPSLALVLLDSYRSGTLFRE